MLLCTSTQVTGLQKGNIQSTIFFDIGTIQWHFQVYSLIEIIDLEDFEKRDIYDKYFLKS